MSRRFLTQGIFLFVFVLSIGSILTFTQAAYADRPSLADLQEQVDQLTALNTDINEQILALQEQIDNLELQEGPEGPQGDTGDTGPQGDPGQQGDPG